MMWEQYLATYGYLAVAVGAFLEGEMTLLLAGFVVQTGMLQLPWVLFAASVGTLASDQLFFRIGRHRGRAFLSRRPRWRDVSARLLDPLSRYQDLWALGFRFLYGLRTVVPVLLGMVGMGSSRFFALDTAGTVLWVSTFVCLGLLFGDLLERVNANVLHYQLLLLAVCVGGASMIGLMRWVVGRYRTNP